ncbi:ankyrin repeat domain-containing protein [Actinoplanes sp. NPDC049548]|uniref:ankyrin repeat domain-containing protein n=1 Tax=Actinoplanes sp. NPDC049548 TaxID=3155152 RepID=UPI0034173F2B
MNRRRRKKLQRRLVEAAGWAGHAEVARLLRAGADPNIPDVHGTTALYRASVQNAFVTVRVLLAAGARTDVESGTGEEGLPLCAAAAWGHEETMRELLAGGADPELREDHGSGRNAREWAATRS